MQNTLIKKQPPISHTVMVYFNVIITNSIGNPNVWYANKIGEQIQCYSLYGCSFTKLNYVTVASNGILLYIKDEHCEVL